MPSSFPFQLHAQLRALLATIFLMVAASPGMADNPLLPIQKLLNTRQYAAALPLLEAHIAANREDAQSRFLLGVSLSNLNETSQAMEVFTRLTEDFPELPEPYNNLAVLHAAQGDLEAAKQALEMAIRANPSYAVAHENLGDIHARLATAYYRRAQTLDTRNKPLDLKLQTLETVIEMPAQVFVPRQIAPNNNTATVPF